MRIILLFLPAFLLSSCAVTPGNTVAENPFNQTQDYFKNEITRLEKSGMTLTKVMLSSSGNETLHIATADWKTELNPFTDAVTLKPAQAQAYHEQMVEGGGSVFTARDSSAEVRRMARYQSSSDKTDSVVIVKRTKNMYYTSLEYLVYYGNGNFDIRVNNKPVAGKHIAFELKARTGE
jgi:hypothetical protein